MTLKSVLPSGFSPHLRTILRNVGLLLHVPGGMALVSLPVCLGFGEFYAVLPFLLTAIVSLGLGQLLYRLFYRAVGEMQHRHAILTAALSWGLIPILGAIPFLTMASNLAAFPQTPPTILLFQNPLNAIFEGFSGFTSTGLTMTLDSSQLPRSLQWWRSFMQWIGGAGVIVLTLSVALFSPDRKPQQLYQAEARQDKIAPTVAATVRQIWKIYLLYTVLSVLLLDLVGMPWWAALNHGMTAIATGGFAITGESLQIYGPLVQGTIILIMITGALSFSTHDQLLRQRRWSSLWQNVYCRAFGFLLVLGTLILILENYWSQGSLTGLESVFQWTSALATCGFSTVQEQAWSPSARLLLSLGMTFGAVSGSTAGGLKINRIVILYKAVIWNFRQLDLKPHELMRYKIGNQVLREAEANHWIKNAGILAVLWCMLLGLAALTLLHVVEPQYALTDVIFEAASALGNVGLSVGIANPDLHRVGKITLILLMWMGRLEIIPVLVLLSVLLHPLRQAGRSML